MSSETLSYYIKTCTIAKKEIHYMCVHMCERPWILYPTQSKKYNLFKMVVKMKNKYEYDKLCLICKDFNEYYFECFLL
jgi:hypothetical protein